jgi:hypothetical protein
MKKFLFCLMALMMLGAADAYSQKWLKKIGKALDDVNGALGGTTSTTTTISTIQSGSNISASDGAFRIVTNHPDFKIKVTRCEASGKTCVIDLILENVGSNDVSLRNYSGDNMAFDDEANQYNGDKMKMAIGDLSNWETVFFTLRAGVPIKARMQIESVPESVKLFRRIDMCLECEAWSLSYRKPIIFTNVPITHDGD